MAAPGRRANINMRYIDGERQYCVEPFVFKDFLEKSDKIGAKYPMTLKAALRVLGKKEAEEDLNISENYKKAFDVLIEAIPGLEENLDCIVFDPNDIREILSEGVKYSDLVKEAPTMHANNSFESQVYQIVNTLLRLEHMALTFMDKQ